MDMQENIGKVTEGAPVKKPTMTDTLRNMEVGYSLTLPVERLKCVQTLACQIGLVMNRRYTTHSDRRTRTVTVTRVE